MEDLEKLRQEKEISFDENLKYVTNAKFVTKNSRTMAF